MKNNFMYIRKKSNIPKKIIARLLNISVYTYSGYETERLIVPKEIFVMFSRMFDIPLKDLFCQTENISKNATIKLETLFSLNELEQEQFLMHQLTGKQYNNLSYRELSSIKKQICNEINSKEASN